MPKKKTPGHYLAGGGGRNKRLARALEWRERENQARANTRRLAEVVIRDIVVSKCIQD
jgi:hypothetical protein